MKFLLDTNVASLVIRGNDAGINAALDRIDIDDLAISSITLAELQYGLAKPGFPKKLGGLIEEFLIRVRVLDWCSEQAGAYAKLRADIESIGVSLAPMDLMIAAHSHSLHSTLVTRDKAFGRVPKLRVADWR
ncbi:MAG TPA: type II toxin-antitoxin system VapC family toxin [Variovorax sp.]|nr:type II toxin-antitoxin system VapC family toxin [Variovorax sp.]